MGLNYMHDFQKLSTDSKGASNSKLIEETLIETGKWALFSIRLPGYLPLTTTNSNIHGRRLELTLWSFLTFYTIYVTFASVMVSAYFYYTFIDKFVWNLPHVPQGPPNPNCTSPTSAEAYGNTESFVWTSLIFLVTYTTYLRASRIFYCQGSLEFWRNTIGLIQRILDSGYQVKSKYFDEIQSQFRNWVFFNQSLAAVRICYGLYMIYQDIHNVCMSRMQISASFLDVGLAITLCYHVGYYVWLTYLVSIFTLCFGIIHDDLDNMTCTNLAVIKKNPRSAEDFTTFYSLFGISVDSERDKEESADGLMEMENKINTTLVTYEIIEEHMHAFNAYFGVTLILETFFAIVLLIVNVYCGESYVQSDPVYALMAMGIPVVIFSFALFQFSSTSAVLSGKATGTLKKLEKFFVPNDRAELQALQLRLIALIARVADNPPTISASHFFNMNRHLLTSILGTVTTYLIVLLQFRQVPPKKCEAIGVAVASPLEKLNLTNIRGDH